MQESRSKLNHQLSAAYKCNTIGPPELVRIKRGRKIHCALMMGMALLHGANLTLSIDPYVQGWKLRGTPFNPALLPELLAWIRSSDPYLYNQARRLGMKWSICLTLLHRTHRLRPAAYQIDRDRGFLGHVLMAMPTHQPRMLTCMS